jgi:hypothetical protein
MWTLLRVLVAAGAVLAAMAFLPTLADAGKLTLAAVVAGKGIGGVAIFFGVLWALREFTSADKARLASILRRKSS